MPAVVSSSTLADAPDTPHHRAAPECEHSRPHTERVAPRRYAATQTGPCRSTPRRRPPRTAPEGVPVRPSRCPAMNTNPVPEPAATRTACRSAGACRGHPRRCRVGRATGEGGRAGGAHPCPHPRDQPEATRSHTPHLARLAIGGTALEHTGRCRRDAVTAGSLCQAGFVVFDERPGAKETTSLLNSSVLNECRGRRSRVSRNASKECRCRSTNE